MKIEEIAINDLTGDIERACSVDYLLALKNSFSERIDITEVEKKHYSSKINTRMEDIIYNF